MRTFSLLSLICLIASGYVPCYADTLTLKTGAVVEGTIIERENEYLIVRTVDRETLYTANEIAAVNGEKLVRVKPDVKTQPKRPSMPAPVVALQQAAVPQGASSRRDVPILAGVLREILNDEKISKLPVQILLYAAAAGIVYCIAVLFLFMKIAQRAGASNPWHAWVPVANLFLLLRVAGLPMVWLLAFLAGIIPFVGPYLTIAAVGYIWWQVARQRNYPGWVGPLVLLAPLGIIPLWLLAFKDRITPPRELQTVVSPPQEIPPPTGMESGIR